MAKKEVSKPNPNGANGVTGDEREEKCWEFYIESININKENAYESAIKAGYSHDHARNITLQGWFKERKDKLRRKDMLSKAEKVLSRTLTYEPEDEEGKVKVDLLRVQTDVAKFIAQTQGKNDGYSSKGDDATEKIADKIQAINYIIPNGDNTKTIN